MNDYIRRKDALTALFELFLDINENPIGNGDHEDDTWRRAKACVIEAALRIKKLPAADVKPVVPGRWIKDDETGEPICSVCHSGKPTKAVCSSVLERKLNNHEIRYCYYCGADMRGEKK